MVIEIAKTRVYYDITFWEEHDSDKFDELKNRAGEFNEKNKGMGIIRFNMRPETEIEEEEAQTEQTKNDE